MARNRNDHRQYNDYDQRRHPYRSRDNEETRRSGEFYDGYDDDYNDYDHLSRDDMSYDNNRIEDDDEDNSGYDDRNRSFSRRYEDSDLDERRDRRGYREFQPTDNRRNFMSHPRQEGRYRSNEYHRNSGNSSWDREHDDRDDNRRGYRDQDGQYYSRRGFGGNYNSNNNRRDDNSRYDYNDQRYGQDDMRYSDQGQRWGNNQRYGSSGRGRRYEEDERPSRRGYSGREY